MAGLQGDPQSCQQTLSLDGHVLDRILFNQPHSVTNDVTHNSVGNESSQDTDGCCFSRRRVDVLLA